MTTEELAKKLYNEACFAFGQGKVWKLPDKGWNKLAHYVENLVLDGKIEEYQQQFLNTKVRSKEGLFIQDIIKERLTELRAKKK
jgi:hypothetical protein